MCYNHEQRDLCDIFTDEELNRILIPIRCLPPLGVHEHCEHDPKHREPTFKDLELWR
jgi:hypothetical protein